MVQAIQELRSSSTLLRALENASRRHPTRDELFEQRVSFVYGSMDSKSGVTREQVRQLILNQEGTAGTDR